MVTSHPIETPVEGDVDVDMDEAVKQILAEMEGKNRTLLKGWAMPKSLRSTAR